VKEIELIGSKEVARMITGELKNRIDKLWRCFGPASDQSAGRYRTDYIFDVYRDLAQTDNTRQKESNMLGIPYSSMFKEKNT
jgi:type I restriction enzyme M protein